ncbi:MAG: AAA family ATPase [Bacilli bacterium]
MYLKTIIAVGFKSFADKTNIEFNNDITGIVGPNGSGKSNIVDAVRWVLGEQSVKSLRGEGAMADIIFSGSKSRNPLNRASVTLILDNGDKFLPTDYSEVSIKRSIYSDGSNEYFLNGEKCRLKDITDLLIDNGLSREAFNIISQGEVSEIVSNKPEERRIIFEEAAGVLKYKRRKEMAIRKLERTHDNLDRINDIINEIEPSLEPLEVQCKNAKEYLETKESLKQTELSLITSDIDRINYEYEIDKKEIKKINEEILSLDTSDSGNEGEIERLKLELSKLEEQIQNKSKELIDITTKVEKLNSQKQITLERQKYNISDDKIDSNVIELKEKELKIKNDLSLIEKELEEKNKELKELKKLIEDIESNVEKIKNHKEKILKELANLSFKETDLKHKINVLENSIENNGLLYYGVKATLNNNSLKGIHNVIGKVINTEEKYALCIETSLGSSMQFIITDNENNAKEAIKYLKTNNLGKATFFPLNIIIPKAIEPNVLKKIKEDDNFIGIAADLVTYNQRYRNIILNQLGNVIIANDLDGANKLGNKTNHRYKIVTLDGELIHIGGSLTGGRNKNNSIGMIKEKYELEKLQRDIIQIAKENKKLNNQIKEFNYNLKELETKLYSKQIEKVNVEEFINNKQNQLEEIKDNYQKINHELSDLKDISNNIDKSELKVMDKYYKYSRQKEELSNLIERLTKKKYNLQTDINDKELDIKKNNSVYNQKQKQLRDLEIKINRMEVTLDNLLLTLNEDYNITFEKAKEIYKLEISEQEARNEVNILKQKINGYGIVNIGAIEEYSRISKRYNFLNTQRDDLNKAENTLLEIIEEMDSIMKEKFFKTFKSVEIEFKKVFKDLFIGGNAELKLTDPSDLLKTGIDIIAEPPGKKLQHLSLLSGGEKTLTAICLLFSILKVKPVPFCILDEVEAALDEVNVKNFGEYLKQFKKNIQFIIITHKKKTMEYADVLYGMTMQESGVSKLVSVKLEEVKDYAKA